MPSGGPPTVYDRALAEVERLRRGLGEGFGKRLTTGLTRAKRGAANKIAHRRAQLARDATAAPTARQRRLLRALGYRGPTPRSRAEVAAPVAILRAEADARALAAFRHSV